MTEYIVNTLMFLFKVKAPPKSKNDNRLNCSLYQTRKPPQTVFRKDASLIFNRIKTPKKFFSYIESLPKLSNLISWPAITSQKYALCISRSKSEADKTGQYYKGFNLDGRAISANGTLGKKGK